MARYFEVLLKRSYNGRTESVIGTLKGLGLKHPGKTVFLKDTPAVRGMIYKVADMVAVTPKDGEIPASNRELTRRWKAGRASTSTEA